MPEAVTHSPGPWDIQRLPDEDGFDDLFRVSAKSTLFLEVAPCADGYVPGQNEANARLLWVAPELLEVAELIDSLDLCEGYTVREDDLPKVWAALDKARAALQRMKGPI